MKSILLLLLCVGFAFSNEPLRNIFKTKGFPAKVTVSVVDQDKKPVSDAQIKFVFTFYPSGTTTILQGISDKNGLFSAEEKTNDGIVIHVQKEGYYKSAMEYKVWKNPESYQTGRWEPWNPMITISLQKKVSPKRRNQIMRVNRKLDSAKEYGFDFIKGKLHTEPNSILTSDFVFISSGSIYLKEASLNGDWDISTSFRFSGIGNGIIEKTRNNHSEFQFLHQAPLNGYESHFDLYYSKHPSMKDRIHLFPLNKGYYIFRISRNLSDGTLVQYYGIIEKLSVGKSWKTGEMYFDITYCLNETPNDRNIEYSL